MPKVSNDMVLVKMDTHSQEFWLRETLSLLALSTMPGIGYWTLRNISHAGYSFDEVLKRPSSFEEFSNYLSSASNKPLKKVSEDWLELQKILWEQGKELYRQLKKEEVKIIHINQHDFPASLREISDPPHWLFVQGNVSVLHRPSVTIVGTRNLSGDGEFLTKYIGACIPSCGAVTVSGLATGTDQIIHKNSIRFQMPTVAILGTGIFKNYPAGSEELRYDICANGGAIITEYLPNQSYSAENFVRRNRLQAGLANVLIPVEWKCQSGTAHTVRYAYESGKKIVCLRMPDWKEKDHPELALAKEKGAQIFTIPQEGNQLLDYIQLNVFDNHNNILGNVIELTNQQTIPMKSVKEGKQSSVSSKKQTSNKNHFYQLGLFDFD